MRVVECNGSCPKSVGAAVRRNTAGISLPQKRAQPPHGPQIPHARGRLRQSQHVGRFRGREVLEVAEEHDLPVLFVELLDSRGEPAFELVPGGGGRRGKLPIGDLAGHVDAGTLPVVDRDQRHLPVDAPRARHAMPTVGIDEPVAGHVPQPQPKGHRRILEIVAQPAIGLDEHVLNDIAGVNSPLDELVHPLIDQPTDSRPVAIEQAVHGIAVTLSNPLEQQKCLICWNAGVSGWQNVRHRNQSTNVSGMRVVSVILGRRG